MSVGWRAVQRQRLTNGWPWLLASFLRSACVTSSLQQRKTDGPAHHASLTTPQQAPASRLTPPRTDTHTHTHKSQEGPLRCCCHPSADCSLARPHHLRRRVRCLECMMWMAGAAGRCWLAAGRVVFVLVCVKGSQWIDGWMGGWIGGPHRVRRCCVVMRPVECCVHASSLGRRPPPDPPNTPPPPTTPTTPRL